MNTKLRYQVAGFMSVLVMFLGVFFQWVTVRVTGRLDRGGLFGANGLDINIGTLMLVLGGLLMLLYTVDSRSVHAATGGLGFVATVVMLLFLYDPLFSNPDLLDNPSFSIVGVDSVGTGAYATFFGAVGTMIAGVRSYQTTSAD